MQSKEIQERASVSRDTLRHYIKEGLIEPTKDPSNGYNIFTNDDLETVQFIVGARHLDFSLEEIKNLQGKFLSSPCKHKSMLPHLRENLEGIHQKMADLKKIERHIQKVIKDFEKRDCTVRPTRLKI